MGNKEQLSWMKPPLGFKNSPILFSGALATDFVKFPGQELDCVLLQYVEDLLLASTIQLRCLEGTKSLSPC